MKSYSSSKISKLIGSIDTEQAKKIKGLVNYNLDPKTFDSVQKWIAQCYNMPSIDEMIMEAINEILEGYGIEALRVQEHWSNYYGDCRYTYVNMGDTYNMTILFDCKQERFIISCVGNIVEFNRSII